MESVDPADLKDLNKGFNKPGEYAAVLERLAKRNIYAITSFIFGMDNDTPGVAERTLQQVRTWPPGLPIFGYLPSASLFSRNLFPDDEEVVVAACRSREAANDSEAAQRASAPMGAPTKFCQPGFL